MSKRDWKVYAEDILEALERVAAYVEGMRYEDFQRDRKTIDAVVRNFEIVGEASKYMPEEIKKKYSSVDWVGIVGLRNRIAHEYFAISTAIVWQILSEELPQLRSEMKRILESERG
ncbi:MAG: DUF86 domain-containing protein [Ignavibacteriae bacterium]|nr:DUF86 domain-containing protein [Ignavibacteriota bacterium]